MQTQASFGGNWFLVDFEVVREVHQLFVYDEAENTLRVGFETFCDRFQVDFVFFGALLRREKLDFKRFRKMR